MEYHAAMPLIDALLPEFDREMGLTRRTLERVPDGEFDFRPHPTSVTLGRLAEHLTEMPQWATMTMTQAGIEMTTERPPEYVRPATRAAVLAQFDKYLKEGRGNVAGKTDGEFLAPWTLKAGGKEAPTLIVSPAFIVPAACDLNELEAAMATMMMTMPR